MEQTKNKRAFKYYPEDFGALTVCVKHMDLHFDVYDDHTVVHSCMHLEVLDKPVKKLSLNAHDLEIVSVEANCCEVDVDYRKEDKMLDVVFGKELESGTSFTLSTKSICKPTKHILEGLYYDETPDGAPPTQITQCQQWGFQRIVPCIDDMMAKCTYKTTIVADEKYTNLLTNGDLVQSVTPVEGGRVSVAYDNTVTPMATYLFFLGVGTYRTFTKEFEYPDGKKFMLELLVPPNSKEEHAMRALDVLYDAVMWVRLFTGPKCYDNVDERKKLLSFIRKRDLMKLQGPSEELEALRGSIKELAGRLVLGYQYTGTVYREIGMQNSDFGGMENVGNTTITTNRIMPFDQMTDGSFEYMIAVKVHEYYHNLNGSEVTGRSPFEIWLNEAVTVHMERAHLAFVLGEDYQRLGEVQGLICPGGTLERDTGAASLPIEPEGFNDPNELITGITYVKAPEFVRMIQTLMGKKTFVKGLDLYHTRYKHSNASRAQWVEAMEEASGKKFNVMAQQWLKQTKYPVVSVNVSYDAGARRYVVSLEQKSYGGVAGDAGGAVSKEEGALWEFPFIVALVDAEGNDLCEKTQWVKGRKEEMVFEDVDKPAFVSLNRGYSFFGKVEYDASQEELLLQVKKDKDIINRFMAFYFLTDKEKRRLIEGIGSGGSEGLGDAGDSLEVSSWYIDLFYELLCDEQLIEVAGGQFLGVYASVEDEKYAHHYDKLYKVQQKILKAIAQKYEKELFGLYEKYGSALPSGEGYVSEQINAIKNRQVKNLVMGILAKLDKPEVHTLLKKQFLEAESATDKVSAFSCYLNSNAPDKIKVMEGYEPEARSHLVSWETFLAVVSGNNSEDAIDIIKRIEKSEGFRIEQSNDQRALFVRFAMNKKKSLLTAPGREYLGEILLKLGKINEYSAGHILSVFGHLDKMEEKYWVPLVGILVGVLGEFSVKDAPSVVNTTKMILRGNPKALSAYEKEKGKVSLE